MGLAMMAGGGREEKKKKEAEAHLFFQTWGRRVFCTLSRPPSPLQLRVPSAGSRGGGGCGIFTWGCLSLHMATVATGKKCS